MENPTFRTFADIEQYFTKCEFENTCDRCENPENGTYAAGHSNDMTGEEVNYYFCGKCAAEEVEKFTANQTEII